MRLLGQRDGAGLGAGRTALLLAGIGTVVAGGAVWRALARDLEWIRRASLGFGGSEGRDVWDEEPRAHRRGLASEGAPAPGSDDTLSPGNIVRQRAEESRTERLGDGTPTGPVTSPPVDPEKT
ncbi:MAG: hypothetical protein ACREM3_14595 [Candidatus Rokuibacteriota bacterium]